MSESAGSRSALGWAIALLALCAASKPILYDTLDPDCFWHLRVAEQLQADGIGPLVDRLSFASMKEPWTPYSWLAELGMLGLWNTLGWRGAVAIHAILNAAFVLLIAAIARFACRAPAEPPNSSPGEAIGSHTAIGSRTAILITTLAATFLSLPYLSFRPATLAIVLLAAILALLTRDRARGGSTRAVWAVVPLTALLANVHLFVFLVPIWCGILAVAAFLEARLVPTQGCSNSVSRRTGRCVALFAITTLASLATPMLPGMLRTLAYYQFADPMVNGPVLAEMQPFWRGTAGVAAASLVGLSLIAIVRTAWRDRQPRLQSTASTPSQHPRPSLTDALYLLAGMALLFSKGRYVPLFAIMAAPMLKWGLPRFSGHALNRPWSRPVMAAIVLAGTLRLALSFPAGATSLDGWLNRHGTDTPGYPVGAANFVAAHLPRHTGRVINEFNWGGYLAWRLGPAGYQTLMDGRTQCFAPQFWHWAGLAKSIHEEHLRELGNADVAILPLRDSRLSAALSQLGWTRRWSDDRAQVLVPPANAHGSPTGVTSTALEQP